MYLASSLTRWGSVPAVILYTGNPATAAARIAYVEAEIEAPVETVFKAWAEADEIRDPNGAQIAYAPDELITVQLPMPAHMAAIAAHRTVLTLTFECRPGERTLLTLTHAGFGKGAEWDEALAFYTRAWPEVVAYLKATIEEAQSQDQSLHAA